MGLSQEELKKINELKNTARFQHSWKAIGISSLGRKEYKIILFETCFFCYFAFLAVAV